MGGGTYLNLWGTKSGVLGGTAPQKLQSVFALIPKIHINFLYTMNVVKPNCHNYVIITMSVFHCSLNVEYFSVKFGGGAQ